ncbi:MAG: hypothetical protein QNJ29_07130 [Rhizobiaceae bacterium]|nr:hypothetical protein [Rhizobiaceae bacterium]
MKNRILPIALSLGALTLAGCSSSGTTYGTGVSHERQTLDGLYNMFSISPNKGEKIDYSARPDLVMPANKGALPAPGSEVEQVAGDPAWPETPEQRIAAVREAAPEADERSGNLPTEYLTSEKQGIENSARLYRTARSTRASEELPIVDPNANSQSAEAKRRREQLAYSTGVKRKFLTEPPAEYRKPADTAEAGDIGITSEEIKKLEEKRIQDEINRERGILNPTQ